MNVLKLVVALVVATALVVFGAQNTQSVSFHFLVWDTAAVPVVLAIAIALLLGVALGWTVSLPGRLRGRQERRALEREARAGREGTPANPPTDDA